jgi:thiosulfate/3-mercaptopyruvate sulfurtransferase
VARDLIVRYQFVDCRWELGSPGSGRELYLAGHIPGASFLDVDEDLAAPPGERGRHPLPDVGDFAAAASSAGIGDGVFVVAYGVAGGAERLWWLLRHFGHDEVALLRGGIESWRGPLRAGAEEIDAARFTARPREDDTIEAEELAARLGDPALVLLDARIPARFRGEPNPIDKVPGRIPGARNLPYTADESIPEDVLKAEEIVAYCGSGVTACVTLFALAETGHPDTKLYPGSWSEWEKLGLPLERG